MMLTIEIHIDPPNETPPSPGSNQTREGNRPDPAQKPGLIDRLKAWWTGSATNETPQAR